jgi:hypothetical protein
VAETLSCYRHPKRETRVSCAACGRPICTECMRQTAVGIKCPEDARLPRGARAGVMKPNQILRTLLVGAGISLVGIPVVSIILGLPFQLLISAVAGYGVGTLINRVGGRNGGPLAVTVSVVATVMPFLVWLAPNALAGNLPTFDVLAAVLAAVAAGLANRRSMYAKSYVASGPADSPSLPWHARRHGREPGLYRSGYLVLANSSLRSYVLTSSLGLMY